MNTYMPRWEILLSLVIIASIILYLYEKANRER